MNSTILASVCVACTVILTVVWAFAALNEKGINPFYEVFGRYRKQSLLGLLLIPIFVLKAISFGSNKATTNDVSDLGSDVTNGVPGEVSSPTNDVPDSGSAPTNAPLLTMVWPRPLTPDPEFESGFSSNELAVGYALWRTGTNEVWNFNPMPGAREITNWWLRGAAEDWAVCATSNLGPVAMTTNGRVVTTNGTFVAYDGSLVFVPEVNGTLIGTNVQNRAWWAETPWESTLFTWQNAFVGRDTNMSVSVQAEFTRDGDFIFRYDLAAMRTNLTSEHYYRLRPEDMKWDDRDGDGVPTHDEVAEYHTDPGLADSDGDGLSDYDEINLLKTDPTVRSVPNDEIVARVTGSATNEQYQSVWNPNPGVPLTAVKLWDGFAADWPVGMTNLVYERTLSLDLANGLRHYFLSSKESEAGDWDLRGLVLEWEDGCGNCGTAMASPCGDSMPLPVTNSTVTVRLRAIGPKIRCPKPMYLVGYAPGVAVSGGTPVYDGAGVKRAYYLNVGGGSATLEVTIDRSYRPCNGPLTDGELAIPGLTDLEAESGGLMSYEGGANGGTILVSDPGCHLLPDFEVDEPAVPNPRPLLKAASGGSASGGGGAWILCLDPSIRFGGAHTFVSTGLGYDSLSGEYGVEYYYPLDSKCLWRNWQRSESGYWVCSCEPELKVDGAEGLSFIETSCEVNADRTEATGTVKAFGQEIWSGTAAHSWGDVGEGGGVSAGSELLSTGDDCDDCEGGCADGHCDTASGSGLNSVKFRLSLGMPRRGQHAGFLYFESENPVAVTMGLFSVKSRDDATVTDETAGSGRTVSCFDAKGRKIEMVPMSGGVRLTVTVRETHELEDVWEVFNEGGNTNVVRIKQISRLNNVMSDETYACDGTGVWSKTDNITGVVETLERFNLINDPSDGKLYEIRTTRDADGNQLDRVYTESSRVGSFGNAVLRENYWQQDTGSQYKWRAAEYWNDATHMDRHGQLRLLTGNCLAWEYHDYDTRGFETLRVEQRNGSAVPTDFPEVIAGDLYGAGGLADAFVTVYDYTPFDGDDNSPHDVDKVRCETRYVVRNGLTTCIARTWTRYEHVWYDGFDAVLTETWRAASAAATRTSPGNAYSYVITYSETEECVPLILRGEVAEEQDEDGVIVENVVDCLDDLIRTTTRKSNDKTYEVVERDWAFGNEIRRATYLSDTDELIDEQVSSYDDKNRLRSTVYLDGTSETNAWSCCRKLWSRDREGRKTLRSAVTGQDGLYYAEESVWLRELSTNGEHRVTQHFFDGIGREVETVVYSAAVAGEATDSAASEGKVVTVATTDYPLGGDDSSVRIDECGKMTTSERYDLEDRAESSESVYANAGSSEPDVQTLTIEWRNGARVTEKSWEDKWTRETEWADYDVSGCEVRYEVTEASDCGIVTNRIVRSDFFGRTVLEETPNGTTATTYHGTTEKPDVTTVTAGGVTRSSTAVYDSWGKQDGSVQDGVTSRTDETYEMDADGNWWKVTRNERSDSETVDSSSERREQLTGRESGVISRRIDIDADGVVEETVERTGAVEGERVTSVSNAVSGVRTQTRRYDVVMEAVTPDELQQSAYDAFGRCVGRTRIPSTPQATQSGFPCETYAYDGVGNLVAKSTYTNGTDFVMETFGYDTYGRRVSSVDALGNETAMRYDAVGNVVEQSGATWPVRYGYDTAGRRISLSTTKDGRIWDVTSWTYDPVMGKCMAKRYPDGSQVAYSLTPDGLPLQTTKASGAWSSNVYDEKRQLVGTVSSDGAGNATFAYDVFGKMTAASNDVACYAYARHRGGIVTNEMVHLDGDIQIVRTVDEFGRLSGRGVYGQDLQAIAYDGQGRVAAVSSGAAVATYAYGAGGVDGGYTLALNGGVTIERHVVRDAYRPEQIVAVSNFVNGATVGGESYTRDAKGRITDRARISPERSESQSERYAGCPSRAATYAYDAVGQVVCETIEQSEQSEQSNNYSYDLIGNVAGFESLTYLVDGEVTGVGGMTFGYDSASRLTTVTTGDVTIATYAYDAFDRRVRKTTAEAVTTYLYDGWNLVREEIAGTNGTTDVIEYYWGKDISGSLDTAGGIGGLLYLKRNGAIYVPLYDASGNVTAYVDALGNIVVSFTYDAFGNCTVQSNNPNNRTIEQFSHFRYSTKYYDAETGLIYYGYRYYAPTTARWLTRDPLEEQGGLNLHCFCENDGVNGRDVLGLLLDPTIDQNLKSAWISFAIAWFRGNGYLVSEEMLLKALFENMRGKVYEFSESSLLTKTLKNSKEYKKIIDNAIDCQPQGYYFHNVSTSTEFRQGDLSTSVGKTAVRFNGEACKSGQTARLNLRVTFENEYNFDKWGGPEVKKYGFLVTMGNNLAYGSQEMGIIHPYWWRATFDEKRKWPWSVSQ